MDTGELWMFRGNFIWWASTCIWICFGANDIRVFFFLNHNEIKKKIKDHNIKKKLLHFHRPSYKHKIYSYFFIKLNCLIISLLEACLNS
jgi:hypothetical protein